MLNIGSHNCISVRLLPTLQGFLGKQVTVAIITLLGSCSKRNSIHSRTGENACQISQNNCLERLCVPESLNKGLCCSCYHFPTPSSTFCGGLGVGWEVARPRSLSPKSSHSVGFSGHCFWSGPGQCWIFKYCLEFSHFVSRESGYASI